MPAHCSPPTHGTRPGPSEGGTRATLDRPQQEILDYILKTIAQEGRFPSYREIGAHFKLTSPATVSQHSKPSRQRGR